MPPSRAPLALFAAELGLGEDRIGLLAGMMPFFQDLGVVALPLLAGLWGAQRVAGTALSLRYGFLLLPVPPPRFFAPDARVPSSLCCWWRCWGLLGRHSLAEAVRSWPGRRSSCRVRCAGGIAGRMGACLYLPVALGVSWAIRWLLDAEEGGGVDGSTPRLRLGILAGVLGGAVPLFQAWWRRARRLRRVAAWAAWPSRCATGTTFGFPFRHRRCRNLVAGGARRSPAALLPRTASACRPARWCSLRPSCRSGRRRGHARGRLSSPDRPTARARIPCPRSRPAKVDAATCAAVHGGRAPGAGPWRVGGGLLSLRRASFPSRHLHGPTSTCSNTVPPASKESYMVLHPTASTGWWAAW